MCSSGVVPTLAGKICLESLIKALTFKLRTYRYNVLVLKVCSSGVTRGVCLVQCERKVGQVLERATPTLLMLVRRNPCFIDGTLLHRLIPTLVRSNILVVTRFVGLLLTTVIRGGRVVGDRATVRVVVRWNKWCTSLVLTRGQE